MRISVIREGLRNRAAAPLHGREPAEVVRASNEDATRAPSEGGVPGTSNWEET